MLLIFIILPAAPERYLQEQTGNLRMLLIVGRKEGQFIAKGNGGLRQLPIKPDEEIGFLLILGNARRLQRSNLSRDKDQIDISIDPLSLGFLLLFKTLLPIDFLAHARPR